METDETLESYKKIRKNITHSISRMRKRMWLSLENGDQADADKAMALIEGLLKQHKLIQERIKDIKENMKKGNPTIS